MKQPPHGKNRGRNDPCYCGSGRKFKKCCMVVASAVPLEGGGSMAQAAELPLDFGRQGISPSLIKTKAQIAGIRKAGRLNSEILDKLTDRILEGETTGKIDRWVHEYTLAKGAVPAPLNYKGYPKSICTSINEVVCHAIPEARELRGGDIMNVDVTCVLDGYFCDSSRMYLIGEVSREAADLVRVTKEGLDLGIAQVRPGAFVGDIGHAIQQYAESRGYSVVRDFVGHGTGVKFHEEPQIPHFGRQGAGQPLIPGMVFTIEPMINVGNWAVKILSDGWTAITRDGSLSAQWEHTVVVTSDGVDVLTA